MNVADFTTEIEVSITTLFQMNFFDRSSAFDSRREAGMETSCPHDFVLYVPMNTNFGRVIEIYVLYSILTRAVITSILFRHYDVITPVSKNLGLNF